MSAVIAMSFSAHSPCRRAQGASVASESFTGARPCR